MYGLDPALKQACLKKTTINILWAEQIVPVLIQNKTTKRRILQCSIKIKMAADADCAENIIRLLPLNTKINFSMPDNFSGKNQRQPSSEAF